jgi:uncharacterized protein (TIGR03083 family)
MEPTDDKPFDEIGEFVATLLATPAHRLTNCAGWTAHELVAHMAGGAAEEADLIEAHLSGSPRPTRAFAEREEPYRALPDAELRDRLVAEAGRLASTLAKLEADGTAPVEFTGRPMTAADFEMHSRSECALHRWDLVGRDDVGWALLGQPCLTKHALTVLSQMSALPETPANRLAGYRAEPAVHAIIRSAPHDDVVLTLDQGAVTLALAPISDAPPALELDAAARLLLLWGRREPSAPIDVYATGATAEAVAVLLAG